ncbi:bacterioferritin [Chromobacterium subtsugae]|uniref:Bacterioferritin n=1 Tax=Chromobacterium subtsugae TaxID=251747 RepID=A0ABS7FDU3_9NEIS|nr:MULTISPECIES: bacterioferritin [Chromobacterium]KUM02371.1 bacterioferritin [Chromobacterium subtsugae]KZE86814.1 bacterioferritin [Chromobacterium sp. F49]MBW7566938.1 bacterioferritin [Chromobacterium subtsugae]MBW8288242.1 bacterioferritin [Chromobacterium subtsugae]OBU86643.1 bacterioferritin [Chromobacterium subtsugae]
MQGDPKTIALLNDLLAEELSAADQYFIHAEMYKDMGLNKLFERIDHEREDELEHARALIARTLFLQGKPNVARRVPIQVGEDVPTMLKADLEVEYRVGALLKEVVAHCESVRDYVTRDALMVLLEETENDHAHWLEQQLKLIEMTGLANYQQAQM